MFLMTCDVRIDKFASLKPSALTWSSSVTELSDKATVTLPAIAMLKKNAEPYERVPTGMQFKEGMAIEFSAGYDDVKDLRFKGFISRINFEVPLVLECEGYSYQLKQKRNFSKSYKDTTVKKILQDLVQGTDIKLSNSIPDINLKKASFANQTAIQVLEWFSSKCLLSAYFIYDTLYVGLQQLAPADKAAFKLGWNVIKDTELKFQTTNEVADVRIEVESRDDKGVKTIATSGKAGAPVKKITSLLTSKADLQKIADEKRAEALMGGYGGTLNTFLIPFVRPGMSVSIEDDKYPQRTGTYFVAGVEGSFSPEGGRQKIKIANRL